MRRESLLSNLPSSFTDIGKRALSAVPITSDTLFLDSELDKLVNYVDKRLLRDAMEGKPKASRRSPLESHPFANPKPSISGFKRPS